MHRRPQQNGGPPLEKMRILAAAAHDGRFPGNIVLQPQHECE